MAISDKEIIHRQLRWLTLYYSELVKLQQHGVPAHEHQEVMRLRLLVHHHTFLHAQLLLDALISGLYAVLETPGWDQKARGSKKITIEHFVQVLPNPRKAEVERPLKTLRSSPSYAGSVIAHSNRATLKSYVDRPANEVFPNLTLDDLGNLLRQVQQLALMSIDDYMDFSIPGFEGVDALFRVLRSVSKPAEVQ